MSLRDETAEVVRRKEELEKHEIARASKAQHDQRVLAQKMEAKNQAETVRL